MTPSSLAAEFLPPPPGLPLRQGEVVLFPLLVKEGLEVVELRSQFSSGIKQ